MSSSSSDDDVPLSKMKGAKKRQAEREKEFDSESESEPQSESEPESESEAGSEYEHESEGADQEETNVGEDEGRSEEEEFDTEDGTADEQGASSSDDDLPLSSLKKSPAKKPSSKNKAAKKKTVTKKSTEKKKPTVKKAKKSCVAVSSSSVPGTNNNNFVSSSSELYLKSEKGKLVQQLLCRWWYSVTWPDPESLPNRPPKNTDALDGLPGLYVYTKGESVGKILDLRDKRTCPNFLNFARKPSEEVRDLLVMAIERQKEELVEKEGKGTETEKQLNELHKWAKKLNCGKADKAAEKVLKASKLKLPPWPPVDPLVKTEFQ